MMDLNLLKLDFTERTLMPFEISKENMTIIQMPSDNPGTAYGANPSLYLFDNNNLYSR